MRFAPTDALTMNVVLENANQSFTFDCLEASYQARMHGSYLIRALVVSDVNSYAFEAKSSQLQIGAWTKIQIQSQRFNHSYIFQGKINRIEGSAQFANDQELVWIECVPECHELFTNRRSGIYLGGSVLDIINRSVVKGFQNLNLKNTTVQQSISQSQNAYPAQNSITQFGESDFAFVLRNLAEYGLWANFRQDFTGKAGVTLMIGDHNNALNSQKNVDLLTDTQHEAAGLYDAKIDQNHWVDSIRAIYFDESQNQYVISTQNIPSTGAASNEVLDHHCLGNLLTSDQVANIAGIVKDSIRLNQCTLSASFQGLNLQPGDVIEVNIAGTNTPFVITEIDYEFAKGDEERSHAAQFSQKHTLTAVALADNTGESITYRAPIWVRSSQTHENFGFAREYPNYNYQGILSGCYGMPTDEIVVPDQLGNIPVQFPYNYTEVCGNTPARFTRVISLSNEGGTTGRTFPVYKDTELQIMFANGNMDYPLIKGAAANADTGHVHNSTVQNRTHYALPQGQYLTYSNVPGDHNFMTMGASHAEGQSRSFMMLSNHQDPNNPGTKKLDQQMITNQSYEQTTAGDKHSVQAGNSNVVDGQTQQNPITLIQFVIGDQTNIQNPASAPMLDDYLQGIGAMITLTQNGKDSPINGKTTSLQKNLYVITQNLAPTTDPSVPINVSQIKIQLFHTGQNGTDTSTVVNIIAQNTKPIFPTDTITLQPSDWQQNKSTDQYGNVTYTVNLNLLAPAFLFNFRQDFWNKQLAGQDLAVYQSLQSYFKAESYESTVRSTPLTDHELDFFQTMGNNVTLFIHGFNVGYGKWPSAFDGESQDAASLTGYANILNGSSSFDLYRDDNFIQTAYPGISDIELSNLDADKRYGVDAHKWALAMEYNLNKAFGWNSNNDFTKYQRLISIAWQGNPQSPVDYMAAVGMHEFPASKVFALIQQLHQRGIQVELMAHSLGNAVAARTLELCAEAGIQVKHAHLWQPAIPDNCLDPQTQKYLPVDLPIDQPNPTEITGANYAYTKAQQGASNITVLFSQNDTILGPTPPATTGATTSDDFNTFAGLPGLAQEWINKEMSEDHVYIRTLLDPAAGVGFMIPAAAVAIMDKDVIPLAGIHEKLVSIYHFANLYRYPASFIFKGSVYDLTCYYHDWVNQFKTMQVPSAAGAPIQTVPLKPDIVSQMNYISAVLPDLFNFVSVLVHICYHPTDIDTQNLGNLNWTPNTASQAQSFGDKLKAAILGAGEAAKDAMLNPAGLVGGTLKKLGGVFMEDDYSTLVATIILTGLLTPDAVPRPAMGYTGPETPGSIGLLDQKTLLPDHSGMLFPTDQFFAMIYKNDLANNANGNGINYFGKWKPA